MAGPAALSGTPAPLWAPGLSWASQAFLGSAAPSLPSLQKILGVIIVIII